MLPDEMFVNLIDTDLRERIAIANDLDGNAAEVLKLLLGKAPTEITTGLEDWRLENTNGRNILFYKEKTIYLLRFFLFCFVYLCLFTIFRSESWRCHFHSLLFDSYRCHTIDSLHCHSTDSQHSHTHSAATLVQHIQWTVLQIILQLVFNKTIPLLESLWKPGLSSF